MCFLDDDVVSEVSEAPGYCGGVTSLQLQLLAAWANQGCTDHLQLLESALFATCDV